MKDIDDNLLSAYVDNELSVTEVKKVEEELSEEVVQHLVTERKLDNLVGSSLKGAPDCPNDLWQGLLTDIEKQDQEKPSKQPKHMYWYSAGFAVAATLFIAFSGIFHKMPVWVPQTVAELTQKSHVTVDRLAVNKFISENGVSLKLDEYPRTHHGKPLSLLGAGLEDIAGDEVVALYFDCCGKPAKVYLLPKGSSADKFITEQNKKWHSGIIENRDQGDYRVTLVSEHSAGEILDAISDDIS